MVHCGNTEYSSSPDVGSGSIRVRPVSKQDFSTVSALEQGSTGCAYQAAVFVRQAMTLWPRTFLVAEYLLCLVSPDDAASGWVLRVKVIDEMRRKGIGTRMLIHGEQLLRECNVKQIFLTCSPVNHGALSLYYQMGYQVIEHKIEYFGPGEDRYVLSKKI
jgi:ribosomal protein S18 acetylase RimI-like enzyme